MDIVEKRELILDTIYGFKKWYNVGTGVFTHRTDDGIAYTLHKNHLEVIYYDNDDISESCEEFYEIDDYLSILQSAVEKIISNEENDEFFHNLADDKRDDIMEYGFHHSSYYTDGLSCLGNCDHVDLVDIQGMGCQHCNRLIKL